MGAPRGASGHDGDPFYFSHDSLSSHSKYGALNPSFFFPLLVSPFSSRKLREIGTPHLSPHPSGMATRGCVTAFSGASLAFARESPLIHLLQSPQQTFPLFPRRSSRARPSRSCPSLRVPSPPPPCSLSFMTWARIEAFHPFYPYLWK